MDFLFGLACRGFGGRAAEYIVAATAAIGRSDGCGPEMSRRADEIRSKILAFCRDPDLLDREELYAIYAAAKRLLADFWRTAVSGGGGQNRLTPVFSPC